MRRRNKYNLSNAVNLTGNMGYLIPIASYEVLPGDTIKSKSSMLVRFAPMVAPPMHPTHMSIRSFFVPYRLIFDKYEEFFTSGHDGNDHSVMPQIEITCAKGDLANYLGIPPLDGKKIKVNAMMFRAYNAIWNEYFRDQDLQNEVSLDNTKLLKVNVEKDYFTTARPTPQKGSAVVLPIKLTADIPSLNVDITSNGSNADLHFDNPNNKPNQQVLGNGNGSIIAKTEWKPNAISGSTDFSLQGLARAQAIQRWQEANMMYGNKYKDLLRRLGVNCSDGRLDKPEYLGGGRSTIQFSEVVNTGDSKDSPLGSLKGHGIGTARSNGFSRFIPEHGVVLTFVFVRPSNVYSNSMPRHFFKQTRLDYHNVELEQLGEQQIYKGEIDAINNTGSRDVFGWTSNFQEYRQSFNHVAGEFSYGGKYANWHFAREFAKAPALNSDFLESNPTNRPFAVTSPDEHHLLLMVLNQTTARRAVGRPKLTTL